MTRQKKYIVRTQLGEGAAYLVARAVRSPVGKYYWNKAARSEATILTEGQARSAARNYGGTVVPA